MNETKFKVGDKVKFIDNTFPTVIGQIGTVRFIDSLGHISWIPLSQVDNRGFPWHEHTKGGLYSKPHQLQLVVESVVSNTELPCPNCQRTLAPEHIQNGFAKCWFCEMTGIRVSG